MSDSQNQYYKEYYAKGGDYNMEAMAGGSRIYQIRDWLKEHLHEGAKVLDVGCGDMHLSTIMPEFVWTGIDINTEVAKGTAVAHDLMQAPYPFPDGSFDAVVCSEVLEHLWDMRVVHKEVNRLLKRGGIYIVSTPNHDWVDNVYQRHGQILFNPDRRWTMEHIRSYNLPIHERHLKEAKFTILDWTGLDAQYGEFFLRARYYLHKLLSKDLGLKKFDDGGKVDQILGRMFSEVSHTIAFVARKNL